MDMNILRAWIKKNEGLNLKPYKDTVDVLTIGYGRNLQDNGITLDEAELMLANDVAKAIKDLSQYSWYLNQPEGVKMALVNMCFNLGINRLLTFRAMIHALIEKDYTTAACEALESKWAVQVGQRAKDIAVMIREGK